MARLDINRFGETAVFVRVVELGGFSAAARAFQMTPSAVSKLIGRLENRLKVRLFNRSTRQIQLTPEGGVFYERSVKILADLDEAERGTTTNAAPHGSVCINANVPFGEHFLLPLLPEFLAKYPEITLDIVLTDEVIDILETRTDVAIRAGPLKSSSLLARKLGQTRLLIVGSPVYLKERGLPNKPSDLDQHNLLVFKYMRAMQGWQFLDQGQIVNVATTENVQISNGEELRRLALSGVGLARLAAFQVKNDIKAGRLLPVLEAFNPNDEEEIHAVFLGQGGHLPLRVRALLDFLVEKIQIDDCS